MQRLIDEKMKENHLESGEYVAVHLRALYGKRDQRDSQEVIDLAVLGLNCGSSLFPGHPVYFASDTTAAVDAAQVYADMHHLPVAIPKHGGASSGRIITDPIHFDKDQGWKTRDVTAYDSTFVDLYMLAESRCVAYSNGGYGTFGSLLSYDPDCKMRFFKGSKQVMHCSWTTTDKRTLALAAPNATT